MNVDNEQGRKEIIWPIGLKIFGIAASLLLLMASVTYITTRNLDKLNTHLNLLTNYFIPLDQTIGDVQFTLSLQRLSYERMLTKGIPKTFDEAKKDADKLIREAGGCSRDQLSDASRLARERFADAAYQDLLRYQINGTCGDMKIATAQELIKQSALQIQRSGDPGYSRKFIQIEEKLKYLVQVRNTLRASIVKQFSYPLGRKDAASEVLMSQVSDNRRLVYQSVREMTRLLHTTTQEMAVQSSFMEKKAFRFSWAVTILAALLGLFYAGLLTRSLVKPVTELVVGVKSIQDGNLNTHLEITSNDEIGVLTKSFNRMADELKEKQVIKETFGKYVDPRIVKNILERASHSQAGEKQVMTVQFSDIEGFTGICEQLTPEGTVRLLNRYFSVMSDAILDNKGIIDKYIGDAVMGFWGPPFCTASEHAGLACLAALDQIAKLDAFNQMLPEILGVRKGLPRINIRIALCTGDVTIGSIGSESARSYTVIGDTVNRAARMEKANKIYGTRLMISDETFRMAGELIEARELDLFIPSGTEQPVCIYELLGRKGQVASDLLQLRDSFESGLQSYRAGDWNGAVNCFVECLSIDPSDNPAKLFLARTQRLKELSPGDTWTGVWAHG